MKRFGIGLLVLATLTSALMSVPTLTLVGSASPTCIGGIANPCVYVDNCGASSTDYKGVLYQVPGVGHVQLHRGYNCSQSGYNYWVAFGWVSTSPAGSSAWLWQVRNGASVVECQFFAFAAGEQVGPTVHFPCPVRLS